MRPVSLASPARASPIGPPRHHRICLTNCAPVRFYRRWESPASVATELRSFGDTRCVSPGGASVQTEPCPFWGFIWATGPRLAQSNKGTCVHTLVSSPENSLPPEARDTWNWKLVRLITDNTRGHRAANEKVGQGLGVTGLRCRRGKSPV